METAVITNHPSTANAGKIVEVRKSDLPFFQAMLAKASKAWKGLISFFKSNSFLKKLSTLAAKIAASAKGKIALAIGGAAAVVALAPKLVGKIIRPVWNFTIKATRKVAGWAAKGAARVFGFFKRSSKSENAARAAKWQRNTENAVSKAAIAIEAVAKRSVQVVRKRVLPVAAAAGAVAGIVAFTGGAGLAAAATAAATGTATVTAFASLPIVGATLVNDFREMRKIKKATKATISSMTNAAKAEVLIENVDVPEGASREEVIDTFVSEAVKQGIVPAEGAELTKEIMLVVPDEHHEKLTKCEDLEQVLDLVESPEAKARIVESMSKLVDDELVSVGAPSEESDKPESANAPTGQNRAQRRAASRKKSGGK